jgi:hypothetical protein
MQAKLDALSDGLRCEDDDVFVIARVGNGIYASEVVAAALWAFLRNGTKAAECVIRAVNFGGDTVSAKPTLPDNLKIDGALSSASPSVFPEATFNAIPSHRRSQRQSLGRLSFDGNVRR